MKKKLILPIVIIVTVLGTIVAQVAILSFGGKGRLARMPVIGNAFTIIEKGEEVIEEENPRFKEVDVLVDNLKRIIAEKEALQKEQMEVSRRQRDYIKRLLRDIEDLNRELNKTVVTLEANRSERLRARAAILEKTDPKTVALLFKSLDDEDCAGLIYNMQERQAAKIIEAYAQMGVDDITRDDNARRMADITRIIQKLVIKSDEGGE